MNWWAWGWLILSTFGCGLGDYYSKRFIQIQETHYLVFLFLGYLASVIFWLFALHLNNQLASMGLSWMIINLITVAILGLVVFSEPFSNYQWAGFLLAVISIFLLNIE